MPKHDDPIVQLAVDTLAKDQAVSKDKIQVEGVRAVDWPDSSLGCPRPGEMYMQVITPGHRVTLRINNKVFSVHEAKGRAIVCKAASAPSESPPGHVGRPGRPGAVDLAWGAKGIEARADLARRLDVNPSAIQVVSGEPMTWPDSGLGCSDAAVQPGTGPVKGYVIRLKHGSNDYRYHTDLKRLLPCTKPPVP